jgi:hypothetical protein
MAGVYGDMLAAFPELLQEYRIFSMTALVGGGFGERTYKEGTMTGYFARDMGGAAESKDTNFVPGQKVRFFCFDEIPKGSIDQGMYVEDEGEIYKFNLDDSFVREGGFIRYLMTIVAGPTDQQLPNTQVEANILNGY